MTSHVLALLLLGSAADVRPAAESYYVLVFGGHKDMLRIETGHTWATFVRAATRPDGTVELEPVTISWMPASLNVRPHALRAEPGKNLTLEESIAWATGPRSQIAVWGPYETSPQIFAQARNQANILESGCVKYRVFDRFDRLPDVEHCIHAVTRVDSVWERAANPVKGNGTHGTTHVVKALLNTGTGTRPCVSADWLYCALGLDRTHFTRRD